MVECPTEDIYGFGVLDVCMNISSERGNAFTCTNKAAMEANIKTQMTDNQCLRGNLPFFGMSEMCICDTDGCNYEARSHELPHESTGNPVNSANPCIVYATSRFFTVDKQAN